MASLVKRGFAHFGSSDASDEGSEPDKYRLLITAGPSYDTSKHQIVPVNGDDSIEISNEFLTAKVKVRVRGYRGLPSQSPSTSAYFDDPVHDKDQYSVAFSFVPKQDLPSLDTVWGNDFDHPIRDRLPPGFNTAFKIVKEFIDPGLACDAYADEPWLYGPSLSCWFAFRMGDVVDDGQDFPAPSDSDVMKDGADGSGKELRQRLSIPDNNEKRRKFYLDAANRKKLIFEKGRLYQADFYNPYLDFGNLALKLPGFSIKVFKYVDTKSHQLRYVFKNRTTGDMYLNVNFNLLWGEKLEEALEKEKQTSAHTTAPESGAEDRNEQATQKSAEEPHVSVDDAAQSTWQPAPDEVDNSRRDVKTTVAAVPADPNIAPAQSQKVQQANETAQPIDLISKMLAKTSTADKRGQETHILD